MLGDGCLSEHVNKENKRYYLVSITGNYYDDKPFYNSIVIPLINLLRKNKKSIKFKERIDYGKIEILFSDKVLFNELKDIGFPIGKKGNKLKISNIFYNKNLLKYLVQGVFATDGSLVLTKNPNKFYPRLEVHGISPKLILQIKDYLVKIGLDGNFYKCKRKKPYFKNAQSQYRLQFNGSRNLILFEKKIGFLNSKQLSKFSNFLRYSDEYNNKIEGIPAQKQKFFRKNTYL